MTHDSRTEEFVPDRGDMIWVQLGPTTGHEQSGRRLVLVLTPSGYNAKTGLAIICPLTSRQKGYPFEVTVPEGGVLTGVILADHVRSIDWRSCRAGFAATLPTAVVSDVLARLSPLLSAG